MPLTHSQLNAIRAQIQKHKSALVFRQDDDFEIIPDEVGNEQALFPHGAVGPPTRIPVKPSKAFFPCCNALLDSCTDIPWSQKGLELNGWTFWARAWQATHSQTVVDSVDYRTNPSTNQEVATIVDQFEYWFGLTGDTGKALDLRDIGQNCEPPNLAPIRYATFSDGNTIQWNCKNGRRGIQNALASQPSTLINFSNCELTLGDVVMLMYALVHDFLDLGWTLNVAGNCDAIPAALFMQGRPGWELENNGWEVLRNNAPSGTLPTVRKHRDPKQPTPTLAMATPLVDLIVEALAPTLIKLYGSVPQHRAKPGSDLDLLIVVPDLDKGKLWQQSTFLKKFLPPQPVPIDTAILTQDLLDEYMSFDCPLKRGLTAATAVLYEA